jgi:transcriptional regulator GlxA family with amidase domain
MDRMPPPVVAVLTFRGMQVLDATGPHEVFSGVNALVDQPAYDVRIVSERGGAVASESGLALLTDPWSALPRAVHTLIVPGGPATRTMTAESAEVRWLASVAPRAERLATVCSGTFVAACAGLLDGHRVTTHWRFAERLQRIYPALTVDADPIYINEGHLWTSAGVTAGIDLALAMVEADHGCDIAQAVARDLVMFLRRPGGQSQFAAPMWTERATDAPVRAVQLHVDANPGDDLGLAALAARAAMSERHFARLFTRQVGVTPARYVERVRIEAARRRLERDDTTTSVVAKECGFGSAETLRRAFHRHLGVSPDDYRQRFATRPIH